MSDAENDDDPFPVPGSRIKSWQIETGIGKDDRLDVTIRFWGGLTLLLRGALGEALTIDVRGPNAPQNLYEVARNINHELGMPWTDPRTGVTHEPPVEPIQLRVKDLTPEELDNLIALVSDTGDPEWHPVENKLRAMSQLQSHRPGKQE